jgi:glycosyltransferase involved in cell wall biosynthesis
VREGLLTCPGRLDDVRDELAAAHVFVLPSYREGMPRSTLEALATGRAIVTTDVPGCRETVIPGENGLLVPPRDPRALAAACERLLGDREALGRMGAASRKLAESRFDVRAVNATLVGLLT